MVSHIKTVLQSVRLQRLIEKRLGSDEEGVPYHLHLLNLYFGEKDDKKDVCLRRYRRFALELKTKPLIIRNLIGSLNWRPALVGNAVVIFLRAEEFQSDLIRRVENGNWVSPQLSVGIALLDHGSGEKELQRIIENASEESNPKTIMSIYSALRFLGSEIADEFQRTKLFEVLKEKDSWDDSITIAEQHWQFWKNIEPLN